MIAKHKQRGASFVFWVFFLALIGFLMMLGLKLFPVYYKGLTTKDIVESIALDMSSKKPNKKQIWQSIEKRLDINSVYGIKKEHFVYSKDKNGIEFGLNYETRVPVIGNIDVVASFDQRQTISTK